MTNASDTGAALHRMIESWVDTDTWDLRVGGIDTNGVEAESVSESGSPGTTGLLWDRTQST